LHFKEHHDTNTVTLYVQPHKAVQLYIQLMSTVILESIYPVNKIQSEVSRSTAILGFTELAASLKTLSQPWKKADLYYVAHVL